MCVKLFLGLASSVLCFVCTDKGLKCPVCLLEFEERETVREMPCKHLFHSGCILPWLGKVMSVVLFYYSLWCETFDTKCFACFLSQTNSCPLCRLELPTDNPDYEEFKKDKVSYFFLSCFCYVYMLPAQLNSGFVL